ncbi:MAG: type VI secretion system baseplate subunit TssE [Gammaproteobacteria bacterium]|nr:type VI secretion system baseplate subunit TssE [Gammaproteobacteria bacterium]
MAHEQTLLERMAGDYREPGLEVDPGRLAASVMGHLQRMFNVRQGNVEMLPDYGLPDYNSLNQEYSNAIIEFRKAIRRSIELYEPRLKHVSVRHVRDDEDPLKVKYEISARLVVRGRSRPVTFKTVLGDRGRVTVNG